MEPPDEFDDVGPLTSLSPGRARSAARIAVLVVLILSIVVLAFVSGRGIVVVPPDVTATPTAAAGTATAAIAERSMLAAVDGASHLTTMDALGGSIARYGSPDVAFSFAAWSPDGTHIAAIGQSAAGTGVYVFAAARGGAAASAPAVIYQSPDTPPFYLYWSPDSDRIAFLTTQPDGIALRIAPADASAQAIAIRFGSPLYWAWADPARLVIHSGGEGGGSFMGEVGLDGTSLEPVPIAAGGFRAPAITADGAFLAYVTPGSPAPEQVVVEARDRSGRHSVGVFGAAALDFGPVGASLAFIAPAAAGAPANLPVGPLRIIDAVSGAVRTLLADSVVAFDWSPDGSIIAALQIAAPGDTNVASVGNVLAAAPAPGVPLRLAFVNAASGAIKAQGSVRVTDAFVQQLLPFFDQYALSHRTWSSDGASIALPTVATDGTSQLSIIRTDGVTAGTLANEVAGSWRP